MPRTETALAVHGSIRNHPQGSLLVLAEPLRGYDTFLSGFLDLSGRRLPVRILTFDDLTVLHPTEAITTLPPCGEPWSGTLHLPHGQRPAPVPDDLAAALDSAGCDLAALDTAETRHLLTYLAEATSERVRRERIAVILQALKEANE